MSNFFFNSLSLNNGNFSGTLPQQNCNNQDPLPLSGGSPVSCSDLLYTIWSSYQTTVSAKFSINQYKIHAPTVSLFKGPKNIFIIRHGEKNTSSGGSLDANGAYRACKFIDFVNQLAKSGYPISYILTCSPCTYNKQNPSMRPQQTLELTSFMLNIPILIYGGAQDFNSVTSELFNSGAFDGLNILISWEHAAIQGLALNILNEAGLSGRLPSSVLTAQPNPNLYGDEYFKQFSTLYNLCTNGNFLCSPSKPNYNSITSNSTSNS